jgi:hypothetical protein
LTPPAPRFELPPPVKSDDGSRFVTAAEASQAGLDRKGEEYRKAIQDQLARGLEGSGTGSPGAGRSGQLSTQQKRLKRWQLTFQVSGPADHLRQLAALSAMVAVPDPAGGFRLFDRLGHPPYVGKKIANLSETHRIGFTHNEGPSVVGIAQLLGMPAPPLLVVFLPQWLEEEMTRMEMQVQGLPEDELHERFQFFVVERRGTYEVVPQRRR